MPFTVITLSKATPALKGDLTKWMQEIAKGVYIGNLNSRIRNQLWERVQNNIGKGEATLSYSYRNEMGYQFETYNTKRENFDFEGIPIVLIPNQNQTYLELGYSQASQFQRARKFAKSKKKNSIEVSDYIVLDIETSGLSVDEDNIIEIGALKISNNSIQEFNQIININKKLPTTIIELTGITSEILESDGLDVSIALSKFSEFIEDYPIVGYSIDFDLSFLNKELMRVNMGKITNESYDILKFVRKEKKFMKSFKLESVLHEYGINEKVKHRALDDARLTYLLGLKVNEFQEFMNRKATK